jgi:glucose-6-phosphate dehydrogenase assembly protein OpcA
LTTTEVVPQHAEEWSGEDVSVSEVERELAALQATVVDTAAVRTSVMTHIAWVPERWLPAAQQTLAGLEERHPSRTLVVVPHPEVDVDRIDAKVSVRRFDVGGAEWSVWSEIVELRLLGRRAKAPASIVEPLLVADLPVFLRWRGEPPFGATELEQLVDVTDRLVVDSSEWEHLPAVYAELVARFNRAAVSDLAWTRALVWRGAVARLWPDVAQAQQIRVRGPYADALLLAGWLRSRLDRRVELVHDAAESLESVAIDGADVPEPVHEELSSSEQLSRALDVFARDPIYEAAVEAATAT